MIKQFFLLLFCFLFDILVLLSVASCIDQALLLLGFPAVWSLLGGLTMVLFVGFYLRQRHLLRGQLK